MPTSEAALPTASGAEGSSAVMAKTKMQGCGMQLLDDIVSKKVDVTDLSDFKPVPDMIHMSHMTVESILHNLTLRYNEDKIYTSIGPSILVAVNPYKTLPIYTNEILHSYTDHTHGQMPPHMYALADLIYRNMTATGGNQSVVVSGESGAGKTESCRFLIQYFISVTGNTTRVERQLVHANHVLESFGNACTERNDNSSRFGKFTKIYFGGDEGNVVGSQITVSNLLNWRNQDKCHVVLHL